MAEVYHNNIIDIDLESGTLFRSFLNHTIGSGDNNANWYGVRVCCICWMISSSPLVSTLTASSPIARR